MEIKQAQEKVEILKASLISAIGSMEREDAHPQQRNADTNTSVRSARNVDMVN
jgi:hypothetical protein